MPPLPRLIQEQGWSQVGTCYNTDQRREPFSIVDQLFELCV